MEKFGQPLKGGGFNLKETGFILRQSRVSLKHKADNLFAAFIFLFLCLTFHFTPPNLTSCKNLTKSN